MSQTPEPPPYPWLTIESVQAWLKLDAGNAQLTAVAEDCRQASAAYCEDQRPDLVQVVDGAPVFMATPEVHMAALISTARLYERRNSPTGLTSFGEFGGADILRVDPDVDRLLGIGRYAPPRIG